MLSNHINLEYFDKNSLISNSKRIQNIVRPYVYMQNIIPELSKIKQFLNNIYINNFQNFEFILQAIIQKLLVVAKKIQEKELQQCLKVLEFCQHITLNIYSDIFEIQIQVLNEFGRFYQSQQKFQQSEEKYLNALRISESIEDKQNQSLLFLNLSILYLENKDYIQAYQYAQNGLFESSKFYNELILNESNFENKKYVIERHCYILYNIGINEKIQNNEDLYKMYMFQSDTIQKHYFSKDDYKQLKNFKIRIIEYLKGKQETVKITQLKRPNTARSNKLDYSKIDSSQLKSSSRHSAFKFKNSIDFKNSHLNSIEYNQNTELFKNNKTFHSQITHNPKYSITTSNKFINKSRNSNQTEQFIQQKSIKSNNLQQTFRFKNNSINKSYQQNKTNQQNKSFQQIQQQQLQQQQQQQQKYQQFQQFQKIEQQQQQLQQQYQMNQQQQYQTTQQQDQTEQSDQYDFYDQQQEIYQQQPQQFNQQQFIQQDQTNQQEFYQPQYTQQDQKKQQELYKSQYIHQEQIPQQLEFNQPQYTQQDQIPQQQEFYQTQYTQQDQIPQQQDYILQQRQIQFQSQVTPVRKRESFNLDEIKDNIQQYDDYKKQMMETHPELKQIQEILRMQQQNQDQIQQKINEIDQKYKQQFLLIKETPTKSGQIYSNKFINNNLRKSEISNKIDIDNHPQHMKDPQKLIDQAYLKRKTIGSTNIQNTIKKVGNVESLLKPNKNQKKIQNLIKSIFQRNDINRCFKQIRENVHSQILKKQALLKMFRCLKNPIVKKFFNEYKLKLKRIQIWNIICDKTKRIFKFHKNELAEILFKKLKLKYTKCKALFLLKKISNKNFQVKLQTYKRRFFNQTLLAAKQQKKQCQKAQSIRKLFNTIKSVKRLRFNQELKNAQKVKPYFQLLSQMFKSFQNIRMNNFQQHKKKLMQYCNKKYLKHKQLRYTKRIQAIYDRQYFLRQQYQQKQFYSLLNYKANLLSLLSVIQTTLINATNIHKSQVVVVLKSITQNKRNENNKIKKIFDFLGKYKNSMFSQSIKQFKKFNFTQMNQIQGVQMMCRFNMYKIKQNYFNRLIEANRLINLKKQQITKIFRFLDQINLKPDQKKFFNKLKEKKNIYNSMFIIDKFWIGQAKKQRILFYEYYQNYITKTLAYKNRFQTINIDSIIPTVQSQENQLTNKFKKHGTTSNDFEVNNYINTIQSNQNIFDLKKPKCERLQTE